MSYKFTKIDDDTTKLEYKDKSFEIKKTVGLLEKLQKVNYKAKISMMKHLKEEGMTSNDLIIKTTKNGKIYEDKSNLIELEEYFTGLESAKIYDEICQEFSKMTFAMLLLDVGIDTNNENEVKDFTVELTKAVTIQTSPSETI